MSTLSSPITFSPKWQGELPGKVTMLHILCVALGTLGSTVASELALAF